MRSFWIRISLILSLFCPSLGTAGPTQPPKSICDGIVTLKALPLNEWSAILAPLGNSSANEAIGAIELFAKTDLALRRALIFTNETQMYANLKDLRKTIVGVQRSLEESLASPQTNSLFSLSRNTTSLLNAFGTQLNRVMQSITNLRARPERQFGIVVDHSGDARTSLGMIHRRIKILMTRFLLPELKLTRPATGHQAPEDIVESGSNWVYLASLSGISQEPEALLRTADRFLETRWAGRRFGLSERKIVFVFEGPIDSRLAAQLANKSVEVIELPLTANH